MNVLFLQSEEADPYAIYKKMLAEHPLYYDSDRDIWAVYSYNDCLAVLNHNRARVPEYSDTPGSLSDGVRMIAQHLVRLANPPRHARSRRCAANLLMHWREVDTAGLVRSLVSDAKKGVVIDWVRDVSKKLPVLALLNGFGFSPAFAGRILPVMDDLVKIMLPVRSAEEDRALDQAVEDIIDPVSAYVSDLDVAESSADVSLYAANLIGLLIQSYDAGRGLLSNSLLQLLKRGNVPSDRFNYFEQAVKETLRFDPPVHHTRRVLAGDIEIQHDRIPAGENILIVLAAANRDPQQFKHADRYDLFRNETPRYLTFGDGAHQCIAQHFSIRLAAEALQYVYSKHKHIVVEEPEISYEPRANVRLPVRMHLRIS